MIDGFESEQRHKKILNNIKKKWRDLSNEHTMKVEKMRIKNEKAYQERQNKFIEKLKKKDEIIEKQKELRSELILEEKKRRQEIAKKKSDDVLKNLEEFRLAEEENRLELEEETFEKCNINLFL